MLSTSFYFIILCTLDVNIIIYMANIIILYNLFFIRLLPDFIKKDLIYYSYIISIIWSLYIVSSLYFHEMINISYIFYVINTIILLNKKTYKQNIETNLFLTYLNNNLVDIHQNYYLFVLLQMCIDNNDILKCKLKNIKNDEDILTFINILHCIIAIFLPNPLVILLLVVLDMYIGLLYTSTISISDELNIIF